MTVCSVTPIFALANAGVNLSGLSLGGNGARVSTAIVVSLLAGKPIGVVLSSALALWTKFAALPDGLGRRHLVVLGVVAGIGFTMSLFVAQLAFSDPALLSAAKLGVLIASAVAMILGLIFGRLLLPLRESLEPETER